jgi:WD40 repeat protein
MFREPMALEEKEPPLTTVTQTAPGAGESGPTAGAETDVAQLKERDSKRYQFIAEHGRGGLGRVMRTRDKDLGREVAIKEILNPGGLSEARFVREAMITARLEHPGIVPVHDAGRWPDGTPFYSMKLVEGRPLKELIAEKKTLETRLGLLPYVLAVAETIAYAHSRRIIHRDLKPSNVIVGAFGETIVIDWGLAKDLDEQRAFADFIGDPYRRLSDQSDATVAGQVLGTPAYMPPEQARGAEVDERADIYAVGAILYHVLTGRPPFKGSTSAEVLAAVTSGPPPSIAALEPSVPQDLAAIAGKAMRRDASERYFDARTMVEDLQRFQSGHLVRAYAYGPSALLLKWLRRHPAIVTAAIAAVVVSTVGGLMAYSQVAHERDQAQTQRTRAENALQQAREQNGKLVLSQAAAVLETDPTSALGFLKSYAGDEWARVRSLAALANARGVARLVLSFGGGQILQLRAVGTGEGFVFVSQQGLLAQTTGPEWKPRPISKSAEPFFDTTADGASLVFAAGSAVMLYDFATASVRTLGKHASKVTAVSAERSGRWFVSASADGGVNIWLPDGHLLAQLAGHGELITSVAAAPAGDSVAFTGHDLVARLWRFAAGREDILGRTAAGSRIAFSASGRYVAWSNPAGNAAVLDLFQGGKAQEFDTSSELAGPFAFGGDEYFACATSANEVRAWSLKDHAFSYKGLARTRVYAVDFVPGPSPLLTWADQALHVVDVVTGQEDTLPAGATVWSVSHSADAKRLLTAGIAGEVRVWDTPPRRFAVATRHGIRATAVAFSPDGTIAASAGLDGQIRIIDVSSGKERARYSGPGDYVGSLAFSKDGSTLAAASYDGRVYVYSVQRGVQRVIQAHDGAVNALLFLDNDELVTGGSDKKLRVWDTNGKTVAELSGQRGGIWPIVAWRGSKILSGDGSGQVWLWDTASRSGNVVGYSRYLIESIAARPSCDTVAFGGGEDASVALLDVPASDEVWVGQPRGRGLRLAMSQDCTSVLAGARDGIIVLHDRKNHSETQFIVNAAVSATTFIGDGHTAMTGTGDGMVVFWDTQTGSQWLFALGLGAVQAIATNAQGRILVATASGAVAFVDGAAQRPIPSGQHDLLAWMNELSNVTPSMTSACLVCSQTQPSRSKETDR